MRNENTIPFFRTKKERDMNIIDDAKSLIHEKKIATRSSITIILARKYGIKPSTICAKLIKYGIRLRDRKERKSKRKRKRAKGDMIVKNQRRRFTCKTCLYPHMYAVQKCILCKSDDFKIDVLPRSKFDKEKYM